MIYSPQTLPPNIIACMRPDDRKALGVMTVGEVQKAYEATTERALQRLCEQELTRRGVRKTLHLRTKAQAGASVGWPDLIFVWQGRAYAVELKTPTGAVRPEQKDALRDMEADGWRVAIVRSFEEFRAILDD